MSRFFKEINLESRGRCDSQQPGRLWPEIGRWKVKERQFVAFSSITRSRWRVENNYYIGPYFSPACVITLTNIIVDMKSILLWTEVKYLWKFWKKSLKFLSKLELDIPQLVHKCLPTGKFCRNGKVFENQHQNPTNQSLSASAAVLAKKQPLMEEKSQRDTFLKTKHWDEFASVILT